MQLVHLYWMSPSFFAHSFSLSVLLTEHYDVKAKMSQK